MIDLSDHPFSPAAIARESGAADAHESRWLQWCAIVERLLGHSLDGDQETDGYSIDFAYDAFRAKASPISYVQGVERRTGK
jgi:hypothetical protein